MGIRDDSGTYLPKGWGSEFSGLDETSQLGQLGITQPRQEDGQLQFPLKVDPAREIAFQRWGMCSGIGDDLW
jgi:hypothetical protein